MPLGTLRLIGSEGTCGPSAPKSFTERGACRDWSGPGGVPTMPGGYIDWDRKPTARQEKARGLPLSRPREKNRAVRAFWMATSQLKIVASGVRYVPRTTGSTPSVAGLLTTEIQTRAICPRGNRIPARVISERSAAMRRMFSTSAAVRRAAPLIVPGSGSARMAERSCPGIEFVPSRPKGFG